MLRLAVCAPQVQKQEAAAPAAAALPEGGKSSGSGGGWFGTDTSLRQELASLKDENKKLADLAARRGQVTDLHIALSAAPSKCTDQMWYGACCTLQHLWAGSIGTTALHQLMLGIALPQVLAQSKEFIAKYLERSAAAMAQAGNGAEEETAAPLQK
jgi:hypothetical protein